ASAQVSTRCPAKYNPPNRSISSARHSSHSSLKRAHFSTIRLARHSSNLQFFQLFSNFLQFNKKFWFAFASQEGVSVVLRFSKNCLFKARQHKYNLTRERAFI